MATIYTVNSITLVTLQSYPANAEALARAFEEIAGYGINIDMISMPPTHGDVTALSFTISDDDLMKMLSFITELKKKADIKAIVSSVNHKISVYDDAMKNTPGIAAKVFKAIADSDADIRLITTSEIEISMLITEADYDTVLTSLKNANI